MEYNTKVYINDKLVTKLTTKLGTHSEAIIEQVLRSHGKTNTRITKKEVVYTTVKILEDSYKTQLEKRLKEWILIMRMLHVKHMP